MTNRTDPLRLFLRAATLLCALCLLLIPAAAQASSVRSGGTGGVAAPAAGSQRSASTHRSLPRATGGTAPAPRGSQVPSPTQASPGTSTLPTPATGTTPATGPTTHAGALKDIPPHYLALYRAAGKAAGIDWRVLAAIGKNESNHGRSLAQGVAAGLNFAHCCSGPMQICTVKACGNVWRQYGVDGDDDGHKSVYDPDDAILGAAGIVSGLSHDLGSDPALLLAGYNAGPGNVHKYHGVPPFKETKAYVAAGLSYIALLR